MCGLTAGHLLGGPDEDDRTVLAFATVSRHPGVAIATALLTREPLAPIGVLLALLQVVDCDVDLVVRTKTA